MDILLCKPGLPFCRPGHSTLSVLLLWSATLQTYPATLVFRIADLPCRSGMLLCKPALPFCQLLAFLDFVLRHSSHPRGRRHHGHHQRVMVAFTSAAASSAAAIVYLAHNGSSEANWVAICLQFDGFCQRISGAVVAAFIAVVFFMALLLISGLLLRKR
ncbi:casparian strip membrane protein 2-like [Zingiber officinale]|uniref:casparian strip membrane protein 2-like n=1 Tax=Zingiber officinale TaxID=94328 RepID=UPI001C4C099E|nr:casparian strip membrane protein 2-like [Zingiber officinale]